MRRLLLACVLTALGVLAWVGFDRSDRAGKAGVVSLDSTSRAGAEGSLEAPGLTDAATRRRALEVPALAVAPLGGGPEARTPDPALELPHGLNPYTFRLPARFEAWLADPLWNPDGFKDCSESGEQEYAALVQVLQSEIVQLQTAHEDARGSVVRRKVQSSQDVADRESPMPPDAIAVVSVAGIENGVAVAPGSVFVRHGDSPELDALDRELRGSIRNALEAIRSLARGHCVR